MAGYSNGQLPYFQEGKSLESQLTARRLNGMIAYMLSLTPLKGVGCFIGRFPSGFTITVPRKGGGGSAGGHPYEAFNASDTDPKLTFQSGNHLDTMAGVTWFPTVSGTPINTIPAPTLTVSISDTVVYFNGTSDASTGIVSAIEINSGTSVPDATSTNWYQLISTIAVTGTSGTYTIAILDDGIAGSQVYFKCGTAYQLGFQ